MKNQENLEIIYNFLRTRNIDKDDITNFPETTARSNLIINKLHIGDRFLIKYLNDFSKTKYIKSEIKNLYKEFLNFESSKIKYEISDFENLIEDNFCSIRKKTKESDRIYLVLTSEKQQFYEKIRKSMKNYIENPENDF